MIAFSRAGLALLLASSALAQDNVLVLLADDVGVDMISSYGEGALPPPTPTLNQLAHSGILFRNVWSNPVCSPTRSLILTGRYAFRSGLGDIVNPGSQGLSTSEYSIPDALNAFQTGYAHAAFGKWHLGSTSSVGGLLAPNWAGFSHFAGTMENFIQTQGESYFDWPKVVNGVASTSTQYATSENVDDALAWLATAPEPWFCYIAFNAPHNPFHVPPKELHSISLPDVDPRLFPLPFYRASLQAVDTEIARLLGGLGEKLDRTNVMFIGDNGTPKEATVAPFDDEHAKRTPYEGGINVPLIVSGPAVQQPGREVKALISTVDVFATVLELAGIGEPASGATGGLHQAALSGQMLFDSVSLVPYFASPAQPYLRDFVFSEFFTPNGSGEPEMLWRMVRDQRYKLIVTGTGAVDREFYDLQADPFETTNLLESELSALEATALAELLQALGDILSG